MLMHLTQDNGEVALCSLDDNHLTNIVNKLLNNAELCKNVMQSGSGQETVAEVLHGVSRKQQINKAKQKLKEIYSKLPAYIMEASIRGIHFDERLREVFDRKQEKQLIALAIDFNIDNLIG